MGFIFVVFFTMLAILSIISILTFSTLLIVKAISKKGPSIKLSAIVSGSSVFLLIVSVISLFIIAANSPSAERGKQEAVAVNVKEEKKAEQERIKKEKDKKEEKEQQDKIAKAKEEEKKAAEEKAGQEKLEKEKEAKAKKEKEEKTKAEEQKKKEEAEKKKKIAEEQKKQSENLNAAIQELIDMSEGSIIDIKPAFEDDWIATYVYVDNSWYLLSEEEKNYIAETIGPVIESKIIETGITDYSDVYFVDQNETIVASPKMFGGYKIKK